MYAQITVHDKSMGMKDYHLYNKNGLAFYVFRKSQGEWELAFGLLADDIKEACIDALILRFDTDVPEFVLSSWKTPCSGSSGQEIQPLAYLSQ